jgi:hypothetical protein
MTAPIGIYGGDGYLAAHAEHNFNDLIWRWLGLPTYEGRGLEFIISAAAGRWDSEPGDTAAPAGVRTGGLAIRGRYFPTGDDWYAEAGVGLGKIPTFISNVAFLRLDARMGVGRIAGRNWGLGLTLSTPF